LQKLVREIPGERDFNLKDGERPDEKSEGEEPAASSGLKFRPNEKSGNSPCDSYILSSEFFAGKARN